MTRSEEQQRFAIAYVGNSALALVLASAPAFPSTERANNRIAQCIMT